MSEAAKRIAENLAHVRQRIAAAALRSGRTAEQVSLVGVTKYADPQQAALLVGAGCSDLGESRPQQLWQKAELLGDREVRWHLVGHLQRNKARRTLPLIALLHSADSLRLIHQIDQLAPQLSLVTSLLLEVNISGDAAKGGFAHQEIPRLLPPIALCKHVAVKGLMAMAAREGGSQRARSDFDRLRQLRDRLRRDCPDEISLDELSMGMSGDFEVAIEEGATIVRVGSALFDGVLP